VQCARCTAEQPAQLYGLPPWPVQVERVRQELEGVLRQREAEVEQLSEQCTRLDYALKVRRGLVLRLCTARHQLLRRACCVQRLLQSRHVACRSITCAACLLLKQEQGWWCSPLLHCCAACR
jgi:hypothetical protein